MNKNLIFIIGILFGAVFTLIISSLGITYLLENFEKAIGLYVLVSILFIAILVIIYFLGNKLISKLSNKQFDIGESINNNDWAGIENQAKAIYSKFIVSKWVFSGVNILVVGFVGVLGTILLNNQNKLFEKQNNLFEKQNHRLDQQTHLLEADRRSSIIFLTSNVLDKIDEELKNPENTKRELTPQLIGRIASLSQAMKPYKYLKGDSLSLKKLSPERGQLFISLMNSNLERETLEDVFWKSNFKYAEMDGLKFRNFDFTNFIFENSSFKGTQFEECSLAGTEFGNCDFEDTKIYLDSILPNFWSCNLKKATITKRFKVSKTNMGGELNGSVLDSTLFDEVDLRHFRFGNQDLSTAIFRLCEIRSNDLSKVFNKNIGVIGVEKLLEHHKIVNKDGKYFIEVKDINSYNNIVNNN